MTYQVLARKWRPKDFASLVGQEHVVRALTHALDGGRLHHAYLFTGTRGVGKTTLSRIFAKALNCETGVTATPCGVCRACREIDEGRFVDYVEMDAASNRGVDEMAALLERAVYAPVDARFKVYMIDEVHMLTNHAFNAMLKTLEEPPPHVKFILATTDPQKIPVTVLSRCLQFNLKQMPAGHIVSHLERILGEEQVAFEPQALRLLARAADGSMRDALSLTDQAIAYSANQVTEEAVRGMLGALDQSYLVRLIDALIEGDGAAVLAIADEMSSRSLSFSTALQDLAGLLHRVAWAQFAPSSVLDEWPEAADLRRFAEALSPEAVQLFYQIATIGRSELGLAPDEYAGFTMTLLRMLAFEPAANGTGGGGTGGARAVKPASAGTNGPRSTTPAMATGAQAAAPAAMQSSVSAPSSTVTATRAGTASPATADVPLQATDLSTQAPAVAPPWETEIEATATSAAHGEAQATEAASDDTPLDAAPRAPEVITPGSASIADAPAASSERSEPARTPAPAAAPRRGGASAALDVLRNAGMKVSTDRSRSVAASAGGASTPTSKPVAQSSAQPAPERKPAAPRVNVPVPAPAASRRAEEASPSGARAQVQDASDAAPSMPPWDDIPPDDYLPAGAEDAYFAPVDDNDDRFMPVFDSEPGYPPSGNAKPASAAPAAPPVIDVSQLPPGIALDAIGFVGDWPALAVGLALKGISYQLAFNSELTALDGTTLKLSVPVPQYAEATQVAKLKAALAERLGKPVEVLVEVGPARRTAAALDAAARAQRQRDAEREIGAAPFVQQLIREFGASIVPGSIRPIVPDAGMGASGASAGH
ncbi:DNA polymerase III subunit gamma/tau [Paraburkholderia kururiensis]|uniref:DNA-directed DNA polymerase n=1 Tax=Paraburkholderia kururiensis TaxID=984307 RepID=A0ABZ0WS28_9BURK|nr:DNA polymerase III subunit gamma/tau [Paraburkholderia kururiensis]WQD80205.1 DNA polymerase III subunit gamma/tau [Paraburkholderia kururiensis]